MQLVDCWDYLPTFVKEEYIYFPCNNWYQFSDGQLGLRGTGKWKKIDILNKIGINKCVQNMFVIMLFEFVSVDSEHPLYTYVTICQGRIYSFSIK